MRRVFRLIVGRAHIAREVDDELGFHVQMKIDRLVAAGFSHDAARAEALRQFGDVTSVKQDCVTLDEERERAMRRANLWSELRQDIAYALRMLRRNPGFTAVVVATLALGIGANTAIFTLVDAVLLRTLPVAQPQRLIELGNPARVNSHSQDDAVRADLFSYPMYRQLRDSNHLVTGLAASGRAGRLDVSIGDAGGALEHPAGRLVSGNYFNVLGLHPALGRLFDDGEDREIGGAPVVVISYDYWLRRFNLEHGVIGRPLVIDGLRFTIIGVAGPAFSGDVIGAKTDVWVPLVMQSAMMPNARMLDSKTDYWLLLLGRLAPGVSLDQATAGFTTLIRQNFLAASPSGPAARLAAVQALPMFIGSGAKGFSSVRSRYAVPLVTLMVGVGLLLLIICANVANLLLARAVARGREMGVRLALGAGRSRLLRQLFAESLLLAMLGAVAGLAVAWGGSRLLLALVADGGGALPVEIRLDLPVLAFTGAVSMLAVGFFGLVPALRASRVDLATSMRGRAVSGGLGGGGRVPIGKLLIAGQVAVSLVLLVGASLLVRSLRSLQSVDMGLDRDHLLVVYVDGPSRNYTDGKLQMLARDLTRRLAVIPGVAAVTFSENGLFEGNESSTILGAEGFAARTHADSLSSYDHVGPGYVHAIGGRLIAGRDLAVSDNDKSEPVVLVNETMARFYFPGATAVGKTLNFVDNTSARIVGVLADTKDHTLDAPPVRRFYAPFLQHGPGYPGDLYLLVHTTGDPAPLAIPVRQAIVAADPLLPIDDIDPLTTLMRISVRSERLLARLSTGFGVLALLLAAIGLYGVMTYAITRRTGEIGLRIALGAQRGDVIQMVLFDALRVVLLGVVVGVPLALLSTRLLGSQLHGVGASDPVSIIVALTVLLASAVVASMVPALRAARVAPLVALQQE